MQRRGAELKLIVQIPCHNEAATLSAVVAGIPRTIAGVDRVEVLVIDDGSTDGTAEIARAAGADHVVQNVGRLGLARSFRRGLDTALRLGADIIVNTDGDHQYDGASIPALIRPILDRSADVVVGDRNPGDAAAFSPMKRRLQRMGSAVVSTLSGLKIGDAVSGFRAYSREAAMGTIVHSPFSYTTETLVQAGHRGLVVASVPIRTNAVTRPSRLARSMTVFLRKQAITILRSYLLYRPLRVFGTLGLVVSAIGAIPIARFLFFWATGDGDGHVQSLVLGSTLIMLGYGTLLIALLSDTVATNRRLLEATLERIRHVEYALSARNAPAATPSADTGDAPPAGRADASHAA